jgi:hypothetical protein
MSSAYTNIYRVNKKEYKSSLKTTLSVGDNQLHVSAIYSHLQAEYRFIIGENIQYNAMNNVRQEISAYIEKEVL